MEFINTLLYSWGSDTPDEVYWALNKLIVEVNESTNSNLNELVNPLVSFTSTDYGTLEEIESNNSTIIEQLKNILQNKLQS